MKKIALAIVAVFCLLGCSKESLLNLNVTEEEMYCSEGCKIICDGTDVTYTSQNPFIAKVDATTGFVTGLHVGETIIDVKAREGVGTVKITVNPRYNVIRDPLIKWGATEYEIESKIGYADEYDSNSIHYIYGDAFYGDAHITTSYMMENGKLNAVMVIINKNYLLDVFKHLSERWQFYIEKDGMYLFCDAMEPEDVKTSVVLMKYSGQWIIMYTQNK